jgi:hypothetical protein
LTGQPKGSPSRPLAYLAAIVIAGAILFALVIAAALRYPGQPLVFLIFAFGYISMAALALPKPRLYGYTLLASFLFLGFCAKAIAYLALGIALVEPTGNFDGSGRAWDAALMPAIIGGAAVVVVRLVHLVIFRAGLVAPNGWTSAPQWYPRWRLPILSGSLVVLVALNVVNLVAAFYQIGVSPKVVLPLHLNIPISWLFVSGLSLWAATLVGWEAQRSSGSLASGFLISFTEAMASMSTLSRSAYLFRVVPYLLVVADVPDFVRAKLSRRWRTIFLLLLPLGFAVSLAAVSLLRLSAYPLVSQTAQLTTPATATPSPSAIVTPSPPLAIQPVASATDPRLKFVGRELSLLVVGRWIGLEGAMSVSSFPGLNPGLLVSGLRESPSAGETALYQRISGSSYQTTSSYVFLTTPGPIAVFYYSGSLAVVFFGMTFLIALLISFEVAASRLLMNPFAVAVVVVSLANAMAQLNFPYLLGVLFLEQAVAVAAITIAARRFARASTPSSGSFQHPPA